MSLPEADSFVRAEIYGTSARLDIPKEWLAKLIELHGSKHLADPDFALPVLIGMAKDGVGIVVFRRQSQKDGVVPDAVAIEATQMRSIFGPKHPLHAAWKMHRSRRPLSTIVFTLQSQGAERKKKP